MNYDYEEIPFESENKTIDLSNCDTKIKRHRHLPFIVETIICAVLVIALIAVKYTDSESFAKLQSGYQQVMSQQLELTNPDKAVMAQQDNEIDIPVASNTASSSVDENVNPIKMDNTDENVEKGEEPYAQTAEVLGFDCFSMPVDDAVLTSDFGIRKSDESISFHKGFDLAVANGTPICPVMAGNVIAVGESDSYGNYIKIQHTQDISTFYAHCSSIQASEGDYVETSDVIAFSGSSGDSTGPHLHFEVRFDDYAIDPNGFFSKEVMQTVENVPRK